MEDRGASGQHTKCVRNACAAGLSLDSCGQLWTNASCGNGGEGFPPTAHRWRPIVILGATTGSGNGKRQRNVRSLVPENPSERLGVACSTPGNGLN